MRLRGIRARNGKGFHYRPASPTMINVEENRLRRRFHAAGQNQKWVTDIIYIWVKGNWAYLATVMDLYSRTIVGWKLDTSMTEKLVLDTLTMAFSQREVKPGLFIHSDRGVQGGFNRSSQHWVVEQILHTHSAFRRVFSSRVFFGVSCSARGLRLGSLVHSSETGRYLSGSIGAEDRSYSRSCRAAMDYEGQRRRPSLRIRW